MPTREAMRSLAEDIVGSYEDRVAEIAQLRETVKMDLKGFQDSKRAMAREVRVDLSRDAANRKHEVGVMLDGFGQAHAAMSKEMKAELTRGRQTLANEAHEFIDELGRAVAEGKTAVKTLLGEFDSSHNAMSTQLRACLAKGEEERLREERSLKQEMLRGVAEIKSAVSAQLKEFADIQAGVRDEWQILTATMQSKRGGVAIAVKPLIEESAALRHRVFEYLANHPDGTKITEVEQEFGLARIQMAKLLKNLMAENKVKKQELLYFAI